MRRRKKKHITNSSIWCSVSDVCQKGTDPAGHQKTDHPADPYSIHYILSFFLKKKTTWKTKEKQKLPLPENSAVEKWIIIQYEI